MRIKKFLAFNKKKHSTPSKIVKEADNFVVLLIRWCRVFFFRARRLSSSSLILLLFSNELTHVRKIKRHSFNLLLRSTIIYSSEPWRPESECNQVSIQGIFLCCQPEICKYFCTFTAVYCCVKYLYVVIQNSVREETQFQEFQSACQQSPSCQLLSDEVDKINCIRECISPSCFIELYQGDKVICTFNYFNFYSRLTVYKSNL
jgi:hypothetical protein